MLCNDVEQKIIIKQLLNTYFRATRSSSDTKIQHENPMKIRLGMIMFFFFFFFLYEDVGQPLVYKKNY